MQKVFFILGVCALGALVCSQSVGEQAVVKDVVLENVEALANVENRLPTSCEASGDVDCPLDDAKVLYVVESYSLDSNEETY